MKKIIKKKNKFKGHLQRLKRSPNPALDGEKYVDEKFFHLLTRAAILTDTNPQAAMNIYSNALKYRWIGLEKCDDCDQFYEKCKCEYFEEDEFDGRFDLKNSILNTIVKFANLAELNYVLNRLQYNITLFGSEGAYEKFFIKKAIRKYEKEN